jgi:hypothetical protein
MMDPNDTWRAPGPTHDRHLTAIIVFGLALAGFAAWLSVRLVAAGWYACDDLEPPYAFGLLWVVFPLTWLIGGAAFVGTTLLLRRWPTVARLLAASAVAGLIALSAATLQVPAGGSSRYPNIDTSDPLLAECGPGGVPTWWPAWLPHTA